MTFGFGAALRAVGEGRACDGRVDVYRWRIDLTGVPRHELAVSVAAAYLNAASQWAHPDAAVRPRVPAASTSSRTGDFGEILAATLYSHRLGQHVPFQKLLAKPVGGATVQGADVLGLTLGYADRPKPVISEVKVRSTVSPATLLADIAANLGRVTDEYLISAWAAGVSLMETHPDHARSYALSAAQHLARLVDPAREYPDHVRHAVVVTSKDNLSLSKLKEHWGSDPPVSEFHVVIVNDIDTVIDTVFDAAANLSYGDVARLAPSILGPNAYVPGLSAPVNVTSAAAAVTTAGGSEARALVEAALWHLADWDGMGTARARLIVDTTSDDVHRGLAKILTGAIGGASQDLDGTALVPFADAVRAAWRLRISGADLAAATTQIAETCTAPHLQEAVRHIGAAVVHRLPRHPLTLANASGATGATVRHVIGRMERVGRHALWPSQAAALAGGLLDRGHPSLAVRMPTSAGKTALIELLVGDTLDQADEPVVAVLAPTKALVAQLTRDLRRALPDEVGVRSSHGGLDFDTDEPSASGILAESGVAVMTPERFDLEWRRAATGDGQAAFDELRLLIVDEAHLINDSGRGARLELNVARALRNDVRVVLVSSQFPNPAQLAGWLGGQSVESDWTPTWLRRSVYYRSEDKKAGLRRAESGPPAQVLELKPSARSKGDGCPRARPAEAAALADLEQADGLVVIFANEKARVAKLVEEVRARFGTWPGAPADLADLANTIEVADPFVAELLRNGIGLHHGDIPRIARQAVETAARRNVLRCVVCTPTLLEGVDFPTRTVIAAYPPRTTKGDPQIARLRNLAGRAGRGGRFTSGILVVMVDDAAGAKKWLKAFRAQLPSTKSALARALDALRNHAAALHILDLGEDNEQPAEPIDALVLSAVAEGATSDGELRHALEEALGRTLWYATTHPSTRNHLLELAARRASHVVKVVGDARWSRAFYRSGLPVTTCVPVRNAVVAQAGRLQQAMADPAVDPDGWLLWLAFDIAPLARDLQHWRDHPQPAVADALNMWLHGEPTEEIRMRHSELWEAIEADLDTLIPWVLTGAIEFAAAAVGNDDLRDLAHRRLAVSRLRYGVPRIELCDLVRRGHDRVHITQLAEAYDQESDMTKILVSLHDYVESRSRAVEDEAEDGDADDEA